MRGWSVHGDGSEVKFVLGIKWQLRVTDAESSSNSYHKSAMWSRHVNPSVTFASDLAWDGNAVSTSENKIPRKLIYQAPACVVKQP